MIIMKTKIDIISGFLGAGKTTLIKKLLEEELGREKLVLIENEFGEIGIDGSILKESNIEMKEINSGCICCTLVGDFEKAIEEVIDKFKPERIIIEPSGVGRLSDVLKACEIGKLVDLININMLIAVVDAERYQLYVSNFSEFYENQIRNAKTIVLSRTAKIGRGKLETVVNSIRKLNQEANIVTTPWEQITAKQIIGVAEGDVSLSLEHQLIKAGQVDLKEHLHLKECKCGVDHRHEMHIHSEDGLCGCGEVLDHSHNHSADEVFEFWGAETPTLFREDEIKDALNSINDSGAYGIILRGKGFLQVGSGKWVQFDYVPGEITIRASNASYSGRLCFIGRDIKKQEFNRLFHVTS